VNSVEASQSLAVNRPYGCLLCLIHVLVDKVLCLSSLAKGHFRGNSLVSIVGEHFESHTNKHG